MAKLTSTRQRIAQINLGGGYSRLLREAIGDIKTDADAERAGVQLSSRCEWDGTLIMLAAGAALEDANFHKEAAVLRKMAYEPLD